MDQSSNDNLKKKLDALPPEIKNLLNSVEVDTVAQQIGARNRLHFDQTGILIAEINEVMRGDLAADELSKELVDVLQIDEDKANAIAKDVNDLLFNKIRETMKKVYEANKTEAPVAGEAEFAPIAPVSKLPPLEPKIPAIVPQALHNDVPTKILIQSTPAPAAMPIPQKATPAVPPMPISPNLHPADVMLAEKTVDIPVPPVPK
jgi:ribosomal protein L20A (L18A)